MRVPNGYLASILLLASCNGADVQGITIVSPANGATVDGPIDVVVEVDRSKETYFEVFITDNIDGALSGTWPADDSVSWRSRAQPSGTADITASVRNREGEMIEHTISVELDHPLEIDVVATPATEPGVFDVSIVSLGPDPLTAGELFIDDESFATGITDLTFEWDTRREQDGAHTLRAEAEREDGTSATDELELTTETCELPPITDNQTGDIVARADGTILVSFPEAIGRWHPDTGLDPQWAPTPGGTVIDIADGPGDDLYFITHEPYAPTQLRVVDASGGVTSIPGAPDEMYKLHAAEDGRVYVLGRGPVNQQQELHLWTSPGGWRIIGQPYVLASPQHTALYVDSSERLWIAYSNRVYRHQLDATGDVMSQDEFTGFNVFAFGEDADGNLLTLVDGAVERRDPGTLAVIATLVDPNDTSWRADGFTHVKHRPGCHTILVARSPLMALPSDTPGSP